MKKPQTTDFGFERILVPLDVSCEPGPALELAASIAAALQSRLEGLFIEDHDVLAVAGLPFTRALPLTGGAPQSIDAERLERAFRQKAAASERLLAGIARSRRVEWTFRITRGHAETAIRSASGHRDLIAMIRGSGATVSHGDVGGAVRAAVARDIRSMLITGRDDRAPAKGVTVVFADSPDCDNVLQLAERIARNSDAPLTVLLVAEDDKALAGLETRAKALLAPHGKTRLERLVDRPAGALVERLRRLRSGLIVASVTTAGGDIDSVERLAAQVHSPVLLLHQSGPETPR